MTFAVVQADAYPKLYGGAAKLWRYKGREVILHGPFETGKTFAVLTKLHALLCKYPKSRALMVRQTYASLVESACATYEQKVLPFPPGNPQSPIIPFGGKRREAYYYPNGSMIVLGGLDKPDKFLSAEFDFVYINQAEEIDLDSYEKVSGRATGRAGNAPYPQTMGDCNPGPPEHWILRRAVDGPLMLYQQMHEHNPTLFNQETGEITPQGETTLRALDALTGIRYRRGRLGLWEASEGAVYENFSIEPGSGNVTEEADFHPAKGDVYWGGDDGFALGAGPGTISYHPRALVLAQRNHLGGLDVFAEYEQAGVYDHHTTIDDISKWGYPKPEAVAIDSSAPMWIAILFNEYGIYAVGATHAIGEGIKLVRQLICDGHGVRLIRIHPRCKRLIASLQGYRFSESTVAPGGEVKPLKIDDHLPDALRYLAWTLSGS